MKQFWIFDFRFWIESRKIKSINALSSTYLSDNLKSEIQNLRLVGIFAIAFTFALGGVEASAQQPKKVARIGYLSSGTPTSESARSGAIRMALRELGYIEGQNITIEYRYGQGKLNRLAESVAELARLNIDVLLVTGGEGWVRAAQNATRTIPIVMTGTGGDPVEEGLIKSLARPGGNVTGITSLTKELGGKRLELLKETIPKLSHVAVLYNPEAPGTVREVKEDLPGAARALGLTVRAWEIRPPHGFEELFAALNKQRPDAIYVTSGPQMGTNWNRFADFALKSRLPSTMPNKNFVEAGGLMYYGADIANSYRRAATYIDKILKGAKPADLPVEQPKKFELVINLKTAKHIGLTIPPNVLARADRVIK
jgi:putative ABC transport system substrate-binding protein